MWNSHMLRYATCVLRESTVSSNKSSPLENLLVTSDDILVVCLVDVEDGSDAPVVLCHVHPS